MLHRYLKEVPDLPRSSHTAAARGAKRRGATDGGKEGSKGEEGGRTKERESCKDSQTADIQDFWHRSVLAAGQARSCVSTDTGWREGRPAPPRHSCHAGCGRHSPSRPHQRRPAICGQSVGRCVLQFAPKNKHQILVYFRFFVLSNFTSL